jgi:hypothetical protein
MAKTKHVGLVLLSSLLLLAASVIYAGNALAQNQATVTILQAIGGTTSPAAGTSSFNDGTSVTITATATDNGYTFSNWLISTGTDVRVSSDNPLTFTASGGTTYTIQPIFTVIQPINITSVRQNLTDAAIVVLLASAGGTTIPRAGAYAFTNATSFNITAMPDNGWKFSHWVISGDTSVSHGGTPVNLFIASSYKALGSPCARHDAASRIKLTIVFISAIYIQLCLSYKVIEHRSHRRDLFWNSYRKL